MAIQVPNQESQLQLQLHVVIASDSKRGGLNHQITTGPTKLRHLPRPPPYSQFTDKRGGKKNHLTYEPPTMSRHNEPKLDLKLHLSPPRDAGHHPRSESPSRSLTASPTSPPSSCVSLELNQQEECLRYSSSPEATSMMLVGCPRCLMYVMLAEEDPRCPKCKSTVLLDVIHDNNNTIKTKTSRKA